MILITDLIEITPVMLSCIMIAILKDCLKIRITINFPRNLFKEKETLFKFAPLLAHGVTGNTSDFGSEESRFEP